MTRYIRPKAAAEALAISVKMVYKLVGQGELEAVRVGRSVCIAVESLDAFVARNRVRRKQAVTHPRTGGPLPTPSGQKPNASGFLFLPPRSP